MGRGKQERTGHCGSDDGGWHGARGGSNDERWAPKDPEDDPLRDLRPHNEEPADPVIDDYMWPDMSDETEEDD